jgi:hypothetical protein
MEGEFFHELTKRAVSEFDAGLFNFGLDYCGGV